MFFRIFKNNFIHSTKLFRLLKNSIDLKKMQEQSEEIEDLRKKLRESSSSIEALKAKKGVSAEDTAKTAALSELERKAVKLKMELEEEEFLRKKKEVIQNF